MGSMQAIEGKDLGIGSMASLQSHVEIMNFLVNCFKPPNKQRVVLGVAFTFIIIIFFFSLGDKQLIVNTIYLTKLTNII